MKLVMQRDGDRGWQQRILLIATCPSVVDRPPHLSVVHASCFEAFVTCYPPLWIALPLWDQVSLTPLGP